MPAPALTVLQISPHPDDEALGAPATLLGLTRASHRVVNLCCSLGRPDQHARRRSEVAEACRRGGLELRLPARPIAMSNADDLRLARERVARLVTEAVDDLSADLVLAPSPHDGHPAHEAVGRAVRDALAAPGRPPLWLWGLWGELPLATLYVAFGEERLSACREILAAHAGELARNDYSELLGARAVAARVLGAELVFGFGAQRRRGGPYAELLCELAWRDGEWWAGRAREPDLAEPLAPVARDRRLGWWMHAPSFGDSLRSAPGW